MYLLSFSRSLLICPSSNSLHLSKHRGTHMTQVESFIVSVLLDTVMSTRLKSSQYKSILRTFQTRDSGSFFFFFLIWDNLLGCVSKIASGHLFFLYQGKLLYIKRAKGQYTESKYYSPQIFLFQVQLCAVSVCLVRNDLYQYKFLSRGIPHSDFFFMFLFFKDFSDSRVVSGLNDIKTESRETIQESVKQSS